MMLSSIRRDVTLLCIAAFLISALATEALAASPLSDRFQMAWGKNKKQDKKEDSQTSAAPDSTGSGSATSVVQPSSKSELDIKMESLASQIAKNFTGGGKVKIAVFNFVDLHGNTSQLGMFIAEELITRLFQCGSFEVVERRLLDKVLEEQKLSTTGLLEAASAQRIGSVLGVKAVVTGTVTDLDSVVKINARIISADTGSVSAAAGETINKDVDVTRLLAGLKSDSNAAPVDQTTKATQFSSGDVSSSSTRKCSLELRADTFELGDKPLEWGGDVSVYSSPESGKYVASPSESADAVAMLTFPKNWSLTVKVARNESSFGQGMILTDKNEKPYKIVFQGLGLVQMNRVCVTLPTGEKGEVKGKLADLVVTCKDGRLKVYWDGTFAVAGDCQGYDTFKKVSVETGMKGVFFFGVRSVSVKNLDE